MLKPTQPMIVVLALSLLLLGVEFSSAQRQTASRNISTQDERASKEGIVEFLRVLRRGDSQAPLINLIRQRGVSFQLTEEIRRELREAGATPELLKAVIANYRPPPGEETTRTGETAAQSPPVIEMPVEPKNPFTEEEAAWQQIKNSDDEEDFTKFLTKYPNGKFAGQANARRNSIREKKDASLWEPIKSSKNREDFLNYIKQYPTGKFVKEAQGRLRDLAAIRNQMGMEFVWIAPGSFIMGSETISSDEKPMHQVTIGNGFYMGKYEVTIVEWVKVMGDIPEGMKKDLGSKFKENERQPVVRVSWEDAQEFLGKLNARGDSYTYRLPTEAEWEYACRAGTMGDYAGNLDVMAWYSRNSRGQTHPVGMKLPNGFGLYDMHGNVVEWCGDWYHENYNGAPTDGSAWVGVGKQNNAVLRGGSWSKPAKDLRSAYRRKSELSYFSENIGFRVVAVVRK